MCANLNPAVAFGFKIALLVSEPVAKNACSNGTDEETSSGEKPDEETCGQGPDGETCGDEPVEDGTEQVGEEASFQQRGG